MSNIRHLIEHLAPLVFGAILGWLSIDFKPEHAEHWVLAFVVLFLIYSAIFEVLKRLLLFRLSQKRKVCGVYAEVFSREAGSVVVAPFLVLHDLAGDQMRVFGRAFLVSAHGIEATPDASWKATAISVSEPNGSTRELAYLFAGEKGVHYDIHGMTRVGIPTNSSDDNLPRLGFFLDTAMYGGTLAPTKDVQFGPIHEISKHVDAVRFYSIKFDRTSYSAFIQSCDRKSERACLRLQLFCEPSQAAFKQFLAQAGVKFLADRTPSEPGPYRNIVLVLKAAAATSGAAAVATPVAAAKPNSTGASDQIEETG